jgi:NodT family efflux transporter outer membrane factor (OMF) lipoprotein
MIRRIRCLALASTALVAGCAVGPNYVRPTVSTPTTFKETKGWVQAHPADAAERGDWWTVFGDPVLNKLEERVVVSNQNLAAAAAAYRQAHQIVAEDRASFFPTISANGSYTRSHNNLSVQGASGGGGAVGFTNNSYQLAGGATWEPDLWGKIRRTVEGATANAQASAADLANARLSAQSELAVDYVQMRAADELKRVTDATVEGYKRSLQITSNQYDAGVAAKSDVLNAQTQLANAQAQATDYLRQRQVMEHAIAVLVGVPPADLSLTPADWTLKPPEVPVMVPSVLLQRRPDIAAAERAAADANAQIGVQISAFFPTISLTGQGGVSSSSLSGLFGASSTLWSLGASAAETLIDFGARTARVREARAAYDQSVAQYRQTVLTAFQGVEDNLSGVRIYAQEEPLRREASTAADAAEVISLNQYKAGTVDYTTVVVNQAAALSARTTLVTTQANEIVASIDLITALGGGWSANELPSS